MEGQKSCWRWAMRMHQALLSVHRELYCMAPNYTDVHYTSTGSRERMDSEKCVSALWGDRKR